MAKLTKAQRVEKMRSLARQADYLESIGCGVNAEPLRQMISRLSYPTDPEPRQALTPTEGVVRDE
jgi:hypothetical protein